MMQGKFAGNGFSAVQEASLLDRVAAMRYNARMFGHKRPTPQ